MQQTFLGAFLVVDDKVEGNFGSFRPFGIRRMSSIAQMVPSSILCQSIILMVAVGPVGRCHHGLKIRYSHTVRYHCNNAFRKGLFVVCQTTFCSIGAVTQRREANDGRTEERHRQLVTADGYPNRVTAAPQGTHTQYSTVMIMQGKGSFSTRALHKVGLEKNQRENVALLVYRPSFHFLCRDTGIGATQRCPRGIAENRPTNESPNVLLWTNS